DAASELKLEDFQDLLAQIVWRIPADESQAIRISGSLSRGKNFVFAWRQRHPRKEISKLNIWQRASGAQGNRRHAGRAGRDRHVFGRMAHQAQGTAPPLPPPYRRGGGRDVPGGGRGSLGKDRG